MASEEAQTTGTIARTRRAILDAAVAMYAEDSGTPLGEIARAAGVGRSTLHRYFPDRAALVRALLADCAEVARRTFLEAELEQGHARDAFRRLIAGMFDLGPRVNFLFNEGQLSNTEWDEAGWEEAHFPVGALFVRGRAQGYFTTSIDPDWFVRALWYMLSAGWEAVAEGTMSRHQAIARVIRTLEGGVLAREDD